MKNIGFALIFLMCFTSTAQSVLNAYEYVIVPTQFEGFRSENQYQTSTLVKFYLTRSGMDAYYDNGLPADLNTNRCKALFTSLDDQSTTFTTQVAVVFRDCEGKEQFRTRTGSSKVKQYVEAYREAIGEAFTSLKEYTYRYQKPEDPAPVVINFGNDVKKLPPTPEPPLHPVQEKAEEAVPERQDKEENSLMPMPEEEMEAVTLEEAVALDKVQEKLLPFPLYAQKTETGYQLVDTTPSIQFYLRETSLPNVFLAQRKGQEGILFQKNGQWVFEYYQGKDRIQEELQVKF